MPEYFSYIAIVVAILLIATILVICYPNFRYRSKVKRLYKNLRKIKWESWEYSLDNLNAFRKFDPKKVMQKQAFTHGFSEFLRKTARKEHQIEELDRLFTIIPTKRVSQNLVNKKDEIGKPPRSSKVILRLASRLHGPIPVHREEKITVSAPRSHRTRLRRFWQLAIKSNL